MILRLPSRFLAQIAQNPFQSRLMQRFFCRCNNEVIALTQRDELLQGLEKLLRKKHVNPALFG